MMYKDHDGGQVRISKDAYDTVIVGAGPAGVGVGIALQHVGVKNFTIIERDEVGSSFMSWPEETRFITPSFPSNSIGMLDLNSIAIGVSPAYNMRIEHPTGVDFALHLKFLVNELELPILENTNVNSIKKTGDFFEINIDNSVIHAKNIIWAAGEYQYPSTGIFQGSENCIHTSVIRKYSDFRDKEYTIIGGYESGIDAAYHLAQKGKKVRVFDKNCPWGEETSDPSVALSTFTFERMNDYKFQKNVKLNAHTTVKSVELVNGKYEITVEGGDVYFSDEKPLLASGFRGSHSCISHLFEDREDGFPMLTEQDCSTITDGLYLCGPSVRHDGHIFCFIYKYRQRFAVVAKSIAESLGLETDEFVAAYKSWGMFLDDLSCCGKECLTC